MDYAISVLQAKKESVLSAIESWKRIEGEIYDSSRDKAVEHRENLVKEIDKAIAILEKAK